MSIGPILNTMLVDSALKAGMPTLEQLCSHSYDDYRTCYVYFYIFVCSFFADLPPAAAGQVQLKVQSDCNRFSLFYICLLLRWEAN